jgi:hypothetical protein
MKRILKINLISLTAILFLSALVYSGAVYLRAFTFNDPGALDKWGEMVLNRSVDYELTNLDQDGFVSAFSEKACSALYYKVKFDLKEYPILKWKWKVSQFPDLSKARTAKQRDDYAARIYVIIPMFSFTFSKFLEYVWTDDLPEGTIIDSPYGKNVKIIVVRSGHAPEGMWMSESRNIYEDYIMAFGREPKRSAGAIAIMCDADSTKTVAKSYFDAIEIVKDEEP